MTLEQAIFLFFAGTVGGAINAVAGGGSFVAFPALLFTGVPPVPANATNTLALWVGTTASGGAYRQKLDIPRRVMIPLIVTSVIGGVAGAILLIKTPAQTFLKVLPWLMLGATLLFAFGKRLTGRVSAGMSAEASRGSMVGATIFELAVALYGGYFGGGMGIMMLAVLTLLGMTHIHRMNALKNMLGALINGVAVVAFILAGAVRWSPGAVMIVGGIAGGYFGAASARRVDPKHVRVLVLVIAWTMTAYFFLKTYARIGF